MIKVGFKNARIFCIIGCLEEERKQKQMLLVDCEYEVVCDSDDLASTCDYREVYELLKKVADREYQLLEVLGKAMGDELLQTFPALYSVTLCIKKPHPFSTCEYSYVTFHKAKTV